VTITNPNNRSARTNPVHGFVSGRASRRVLALLALVVIVAVTIAGCQFGPTSLDTANTTAGTTAGGSLITEPDNGPQPIDQFIASATTSLDMTMYELVDPSGAEQALIQDARRGVDVRVILDRNLEQRSNQAAYTALAGAGIHVVWASAGYKATHQKTITVDRARSLILTANLVSRDYPSTRDFGIVDTDRADVAAIEAVFAADFAGSPITPSDGDDLVWSPTDSQTRLLVLINSATKTVRIENEEMGDAAVVHALEQDERRGVQVQVTMTNTGNAYAKQFDALTSDGVQVATYTGEKPIYVHAKAILVDAGTSTAKLFIGSENFSNASLNGNRELGLITTTPAILSAVGATLSSDFAQARPWR
jgi:phosphatidylserine/phosphatidylglycerophosphate/cardiolipin synthase-like enzyme